MKKALITFFAFVLAVTSAMAIPTGFHLDNQIDVTGDWKWDNGWQYGEFQTAQFNMHIDSNLATMSQFIETGSYGTPWELDYNSNAMVNAPVRFINELSAITVNPPDSTPGTAWTKVHFVETTASVFSQSQLSVNGYGNVYVKSTFNLDDDGAQSVDLNIN